MNPIARHFRGLGIALAVLAISAGAAFAAAPSLRPAGHTSNVPAVDATGTPEASETPEATETPEASETPEPTDTPEASETPEPTDTPEASETPEPTDSPDASGSPKPDSHGALVSAAAQMATPSGFPNHGAFVSCVAHLDVSAVGFDWTTVTPASCGITTQSGQAGAQHGQGHGHVDKAKSHGNHGTQGTSH